MSSFEQEFLELEVSHLRDENLRQLGGIISRANKVDHRIETGINSPDRFLRSDFADGDVPVRYAKVTLLPANKDELIGGLAKVSVRVPVEFVSMEELPHELDVAFLGLVGRIEDQASSNYLLTKTEFAPYGSAEDVELAVDDTGSAQWRVKSEQPDSDEDEAQRLDRIYEEKLALDALAEALQKYVIRTSLKDGSLNSEEAA